MLYHSALGYGAPPKAFRTRSAASSEEWSESGSAEQPTALAGTPGRLRLGNGKCISCLDGISI